MNDYNAATHYSYDIEGNVKTPCQDIKDLQAMDPTTGLKRIDYDYDISACRTGLRAWLFINLSKTLS
jgi:hypothetical protein